MVVGPYDEVYAMPRGRPHKVALTVTSEIDLVPFGTLPRSSYKSHLVDWANAVAANE